MLMVSKERGNKFRSSSLGQTLGAIISGVSDADEAIFDASDAKENC
jgi:hypothetical protein